MVGFTFCDLGEQFGDANAGDLWWDVARMIRMLLAYTMD
jgi:hypothetical protein